MTMPYAYTAEDLAIGREFILDQQKYQFNELETSILNKFFTNINGKVFVIHSLPESIIAPLLAMYSRLKNTRGLRGAFLDQMLPGLLASFTAECDTMDEGDSAKWLARHKIKSLMDFYGHSTETKELVEVFMTAFQIDSQYISRISSTKKVKKFLSMWLDRYGHNSIARTAVVHICCEDISILAAKALEWTRPAAGYIELSTRYVDMSGKAVYPVWQHFDQGVGIENFYSDLFAAYVELDGTDANPGKLRQFYLEQYGHLVDKGLLTEKSLKAGVFGETCDVLGNLLPAATLTSVGISISGESLPSLIRDLILEDTPECLALADAVSNECAKIGADQFVRHCEPTVWQRANAGYLIKVPPVPLPTDWFVRATLYYQFAANSVFDQMIPDHFCHEQVFDPRFCLNQEERQTYDKLPREFESVTVTMAGKMSFRGWRDLHRMGFCAHRRSRVHFLAGQFYEYDKPKPEALQQAFAMASDGANELCRQALKRETPHQLIEYLMPLGTPVIYTMSGNLRQMEFCSFQRTKPDVNHEVRKIFLNHEHQLRIAYPWWENISRANIEKVYTFARDSAIPLVEALAEVV